MLKWNAHWILALHSGNAADRAAAAREIFAAGRARALDAARAWLQHKELRQLLGGHLQVTVGVAVHPETFARIHEANGMPRLAEVPPDQDAVEFELHFAARPGGEGAKASGEGGSSNISLDILTTREPGGNGAIVRFLAKQGEGIQQVELRCSGVDRATAILRSEFHVESVYPAKRPGADGTRVNFFLVAGADGKKVLIELYEADDPRAGGPKTR